MPYSKEFEYRYFYLLAYSIKEGGRDGPDLAEIRSMPSQPTPSFEPPPNEGKANSSPPLLHLVLVRNKTTWFK